MKKIILIIFGIIILTFAGCYDPPSREKQGLDYDSLQELVETSDRILKLKKLDNEIKFIVEEEGYFSIKFSVLEKFKGSSSIGDEIFITFLETDFHNLFIRNKNVEKFDQSFDRQDYVFFLIGRARKNIFPKELGGSLWYKNGNPSIFQIQNDNISIISTESHIEALDKSFIDILKMSESKFLNLVKLLNE
ncbi:MAG: hypothetical protein CL745_02585 [Chloroflexi bacterium]|jgi:hypothetical protein|nr:hypothetical protein [Chloroflexota bacterium]